MHVTKKLALLCVLLFLSNSFAGTPSLNGVLAEIEGCSADFSQCKLPHVLSALEGEIKILKDNKQHEYASLYKAKSLLMTLQGEYELSENYLTYAEEYLQKKGSIDLAESYSINLTRFFNAIQYDNSSGLILGDFTKALDYLIQLLKTEHHSEKNWMLAFNLALMINPEDSIFHRVAVSDLYYIDAVNTLRESQHIENYLTNLIYAYYYASLHNSRTKIIYYDDAVKKRELALNHFNLFNRASHTYMDNFGFEYDILGLINGSLVSEPDVLRVLNFSQRIYDKSYDHNFELIRAWSLVVEYSISSVSRVLYSKHIFDDLESKVLNLLSGYEDNNDYSLITDQISHDLYMTASFINLKNNKCSDALKFYSKAQEGSAFLSLALAVNKLGNYSNYIQDKCL